MTDGGETPAEAGPRREGRGPGLRQVQARFREAEASPDKDEAMRLKLALWQEVLEAIADGGLKHPKRYAAAALGHDLVRTRVAEGTRARRAERRAERRSGGERDLSDFQRKRMAKRQRRREARNATASDES